MRLGKGRLIVFLAVLCGILMTVNGGIMAFESSLVRSDDGLVVYDAESGLYWLADLSSFDNMSYEEQQEKIANLPGGNWRMATLEDIRSLDKHPDTAIHKAFKPLSVCEIGSKQVAIFNGRIDCAEGGEGLHMMAFTSQFKELNRPKAPLKYNGLNVTDGQFKGLGAWAVSSDYKPSKEQVASSK